MHNEAGWGLNTGLRGPWGVCATHPQLVSSTNAMATPFNHQNSGKRVVLGGCVWGWVHALGGFGFEGVRGTPQWAAAAGLVWPFKHRVDV